MLEYIAIVTVTSMPVDFKPQKPMPQPEPRQPQPLYIDTRLRYSEYAIIERAQKPFTSLFHENPETYFSPDLQLLLKDPTLHHHSKSAEDLLGTSASRGSKKNIFLHSPLEKDSYKAHVNYSHNSPRQKVSKKLRRRL